MDKKKLYEMREKINRILKKHEIDYVSFFLDIIVSKAYYESIKSNFDNPTIIDGTVGAVERKWSITLKHLNFSADLTDNDIEEIARKLNEAKYGWAKEYDDDEDEQGN